MRVTMAPHMVHGAGPTFGESPHEKTYLQALLLLLIDLGAGEGLDRLGMMTWDDESFSRLFIAKFEIWFVM